MSRFYHRERPSPTLINSKIVVIYIVGLDISNSNDLCVRELCVWDALSIYQVPKLGHKVSGKVRLPVAANNI